MAVIRNRYGCDRGCTARTPVNVEEERQVSLLQPPYIAYCQGVAHGGLTRRYDHFVKLRGHWPV